MRLIWKLVGAVAIVGVAVQFVRPGIENPPVTAEIAAPPEVRAILKNSCYDCHSNETRLKWFDRVVPAYWLTAHDVKEARRHLNFSEIAKLPAAQQRGVLFEAVNMIQLGAMPLPQYRALHPGTAVTAEQLAVLERYLGPFDEADGDGVAQATPAPARTVQLVSEPPKPGIGRMVLRTIDSESNGFGYPAGWESWKPISATDRGDNNSLRMILGNYVAVKAIAEKKIAPWPDGAAFAKVAWQAVPDGNGGLKAGKFIQVEFMLKDASKYADTDGWGWGRWRGMDLKPYGKDAHFVEECTGCHAPVKGNDYVYTMPLERQ